MLPVCSSCSAAKIREFPQDNRTKGRLQVANDSLFTSSGMSWQKLPTLQILRKYAYLHMQMKQKKKTMTARKKMNIRVKHDGSNFGQKPVGTVGKQKALPAQSVAKIHKKLSSVPFFSAACYNRPRTALTRSAAIRFLPQPNPAEKLWLAERASSGVEADAADRGSHGSGTGAARVISKSHADSDTLHFNRRRLRRSSEQLHSALYVGTTVWTYKVICILRAAFFSCNNIAISYRLSFMRTTFLPSLSLCRAMSKCSLQAVRYSLPSGVYF